MGGETEVLLRCGFVAAGALRRVSTMYSALLK
jgi:hypothetical protein